MLEAMSIQRREKRCTILDEVSLQVRSKQTLAILGPSGSGKTSLLRVLAGLDAPTHGIVKWNDDVLSDGNRVFVAPEKRNFGFVFQDAALFPHLNVLENVAFGLWRLPKEDRFNRASAWLVKVGLQGKEKRQISHLSGGERQRVALARALVVEPRVLFLDEPFSSVDRITREGLILTMHDLFNNANIATILVTHDAHDALELADTLLILKSGKSEQSGPKQEVMQNPVNHWVRDFLTCGRFP